MTHSVAQSTTLTCPACRRPFPAEVWLIVDTAERPDLLARIQKHTAHAGNRSLHGISKTTPDQLDLFDAMNLPKPAL